jgi:hypothetical protein
MEKELSASNLDILVKTEPFLRFKKVLFKKITKYKRGNEELARRNFYKALEDYLIQKRLTYSDYTGINVNLMVKELDKKFKKIQEGSFIIQENNVGYIKDKHIIWVRCLNPDSQEPIRTFLCRNSRSLSI